MTSFDPIADQRRFTVFVLALGLLLIGCIGGYALAAVQFEARSDANATPRYVAPRPTATPRPLPTLTSAQAYLERGKTYWETRQHEQAIADFTAALALDPALVEAYFYRGWSYHDGYYDAQRGGWQTFPTEALADYGQVIALDPANARAYNNRGLVHWDLNQNERAIDDFEQAVKLDPDYLYATWHLALVYDEDQQYAEAARTYTRTLALGLDTANLHQRRATAAMRGELYDMAIEEYTALIEEAEENGYSWAGTHYHSRAMAYLGQENYAAAIADFDVTIEQFEDGGVKPNPPLREVYLHRAQAHLAAGHEHAAIADLTHTIALDPENPEPYRLRGDLHYASGSYAQALADYAEYQRLGYVLDTALQDRMAEMEAALARNEDATP